jgi:murein L,D-transpeptidase YcbB/YkuD
MFQNNNNNKKFSPILLVKVLLVVFILMMFGQNLVKQYGSNSKYIITNKEPLKKDTSLIYLDSIQIVNFLKQYTIDKTYSENLELFYTKRNYEYAWIDNGGINEYAKNVLNLLNQKDEKSKFFLYHDKIHTLYNLLLEDDQKLNNKDSLKVQLELLLTINFFDYAKHSWGSVNNEEAKKVGWFMDKKKLNYEHLLDTLLKNEAYFIFSFEPVYSQYKFLKKYLIKYNDIEKKGGWINWTDKVKILKKGDSSSVVSLVKNQLFMLEDLRVNDKSNLFDENLEDAVKKFQKRNGLKEDGVISGKTLLAMSVPIHQRIEQILINMERCKWVPIEQKGDYLIVNIPDFKLYVYNNDKLEWSCNVVVGKSKVTNNTVIFNDNIEEIVFSPYWNIPRNIMIKETLPEIKKNPNYLASHNMEIVNANGRRVSIPSADWMNYTSSFPYMIRQKPGIDNALGLVKFLFPNSYDIYMHDTPSKSLFGESTRMFSHGCIRIQEPVKLVKFLLKDDSIYTNEKIYALMYGGKQTFVKLKNKVPVFIAYFTAWVDDDEKLNFRNDVYHHDSKMTKFLFTN